MNKFILIISAILFASCKNETNTNGANAAKKELSGKELFEGKGNCIACHQPEQKIIGPSIQEIATIYKDKKASIALFLQEKSDPIVDPSQYEIMKTNFSITKSMSDEELKALEKYMMVFSK